MPVATPSHTVGPSDLTPAALRNLQCNVLRSTDRPRSTQTFRRFDGPKELKAWLAELPKPTPSEDDEKERRLVNVLFSAEALRWLGHDPEGMDPAFVRGVRHPDTQQRLAHSDHDWGPHKQPWHVVELCAHDADDEFEPRDSTDYVVEYGSGVKNGELTTRRNEASTGHFDIADGIAKLVYTERDYKALKDKPPDGHWAFDPRQDLRTLLVPDPLAEGSGDAFGSYFVFHKYHQDKVAFAAKIREIADAIKERHATANTPKSLLISPDAVFEALMDKQGRLLTGDALMSAVKLLVFGRKSDGTTAFGTKGNDFNYAEDPAGSKCPFHAHIRKMNPRDALGDTEFVRSKLIARRGISYHETKCHVSGRSKTVKDTGLLFWAAQASIADQFEYIIETWANAAKPDLDHLPSPDVDAVVGKIDLQAKANQPWLNWNATTHINFGIWEAVRLIGGEYLFAPSLSGLEKLQKKAGYGT